MSDKKIKLHFCIMFEQIAGEEGLWLNIFFNIMIIIDITKYRMYWEEIVLCLPKNLSDLPSDPVR